jgi:hypothetical protein
VISPVDVASYPCALVADLYVHERETSIGPGRYDGLPSGIAHQQEPTMPEVINSWADLRAAEPSVLAKVGEHRFGAQLFLVNPVRFLRESGFGVGEKFAAQLLALPGVRANPVRAYDEIAAGRHPLCQQSLAISSLGLPPGLGARL